MARTWIDALPAREAWEQLRLHLRPRPASRPRPHREVPRRHWRPIALTLVVLALITVLELRTSLLESQVLTALAHRVWYALQPGPSQQIVFPEGGPFDTRRGYSRLPELGKRLESRGYRITQQARFSGLLAFLAKHHVPPPFPEKASAGLIILGQTGDTLYNATAGDQLFQSYDEIPPLLVRSLLYMEDRRLRDVNDPHSNPSVDWPRFAKATALYAGRKLGLPFPVEGGSTLAVQLEKYRHSDGGRTSSGTEKLRQMLAASLRAYSLGTDTREQRRQIVLDYMNSMPLGAVPEQGEVYGLGNGLRAWFGMDMNAVRRALSPTAPPDARARAYKHCMALLCAVRAPSSYLAHDHPALEARADYYIHALAAQAVLDSEFAQSAIGAPMEFAGGNGPAGGEYVGLRKLSGYVRIQLSDLLGIRNLYDLDRLHLDTRTTLDLGLQDSAMHVFAELRDPDFVETHGLKGEHLLAQGDPSAVVYTLLLYERTRHGDVLRVHADNLNRPFDLNENAKMELGSTAKLRTMAHYLEIMTSLYQEMSGVDPDSLASREASARDELTRWAAGTLAAEPRMSLDTLLTRAMERKYSASPYEAFFTGSGVQTFENFDKLDNHRILTLRDAAAHSTNLVFIRLMRDLVRYHQARLPYDARDVMENPDSPLRRRMLSELAEEESRYFLLRAWRSYRGLPPHDIVEKLLGEHRSSSARDLAVLFFAWKSGGSPGQLASWLEPWVGRLDTETVNHLYRAYDNPRLNISDYGYLLGRHPVDVWCAGQLVRQPNDAWMDLVVRSVGVRDTSSAWLFKTRNYRGQDLRLRGRIERDAFARMTPYWRRLGFPFEHMTPSYASAIGSSSDRPAALAELMGIILNDGVRRTPRSLEQLRFATDTPYQTIFQAPRPTEGKAVMDPAVARTLRSVLANVVENGTARRVSHTFFGPDGQALVVGGKTGSGDNRFETFGRGGRLLSSRPVSRTAAFTFFIGDRYFGTLTSSIEGPKAGQYKFTSALPLEALRLLGPALDDRLKRGLPPASAPELTPTKPRLNEPELVRNSVPSATPAKGA